MCTNAAQVLTQGAVTLITHTPGHDHQWHVKRGQEALKLPAYDQKERDSEGLQFKNTGEVCARTLSMKVVVLRKVS